MLYYVDAIKAQQVPSYFRLDLRLGWHPTENLELSLQAISEKALHEFQQRASQQ